MSRRSQMRIGLAALLLAGGAAAGIVLAFTGSSQAAPTKAHYFAQVAKICRVYGPQLDRIAPPRDVTIPGEVVTPLKRVIPILRKENAELHALRPPGELATSIGRWLKLKDRVLAALERSLAAAEAPNIPLTASEYLRFITVAQQTSKLGGQIGFPSICSSSS
jgi:hypothetical protein